MKLFHPTLSLVFLPLALSAQTDLGRVVPADRSIHLAAFGDYGTGDLSQKGVAAALNDPAVRQGFDQAGAQPLALPLEASRKFLSDEIVKYRDIITKAGVPRIQ